MKPLVAIIGASGFIGNTMYGYLTDYLSPAFIVEGTFYKNNYNHELIHLDITDAREVNAFISFRKPNFIVLLAGSKDIKRCESDYRYAYNINTQPVIDLISIIKECKNKSKLIYFSSDYIFDGKRGFYKDNDRPNPQNNYGKTKFLSEQALCVSSIDYKIIRTSAVMGKNGVFFEWLLSSLNRIQELLMFENVYFTPTPIKFLCEIISRVIIDYSQIPQKILHIIGEKRLNRYEFGRLVAEMIGNVKATIKPAKMDFDTSIFLRDLSMIQSAIVKKCQRHTFEQYLESEVHLCLNA